MKGRKGREDREASGARRRLGRKRDWVKGGGGGRCCLYLTLIYKERTIVRKGAGAANDGPRWAVPPPLPPQRLVRPIFTAPKLKIILFILIKKKR